MTPSFSASQPDAGAFRFLRERDMGQILRVTFRLLAEHGRELGGGVAAIAGPAYLITAVFSAIADPNDVGQQMTVSLVGVLPGLLLTVAVLGYVRLYRQGLAGQIAVADLWEEAKPLMMPVLGYQLLLAVGAVVLAAALIALGTAGGTGGIILAGVLVLGLGLWAMPRFLIGLVVRGIEEEGTFDAVARAHALVKERPGIAYGTTYLLIGIIMFLAIILGGAVGGIVLVMTDPRNPSPLALGLSSLLTFAVLMVASTIYTLASAFLHGALVESVEGTTLLDDLDALASGHAPPAPVEAHAEPQPFAPPASAAAPAETPADDAAPPAEAPPRGFRGGGFEGPA
jgi:hypothetical protein